MTQPDIRVEQLPEAPDLPFRLGRHIVHDERSRAFAFTAPEPLPLPLRDVRLAVASKVAESRPAGRSFH